jgi:hypothetical protein
MAAIAQQQAAQGGDDGVGAEQYIQVSGCQHATVGPIVRGGFVRAAGRGNHGKHVYMKDTHTNGLDVMIYFWDKRDGAAVSGWWIGPKIGGDQVWAYHASKTASSPPKTGWKVAYSALSTRRALVWAGVDQSFVIHKAMEKSTRARSRSPRGLVHGHVDPHLQSQPILVTVCTFTNELQVTVRSHWKACNLKACLRSEYDCDCDNIKFTLSDGLALDPEIRMDSLPADRKILMVKQCSGCGGSGRVRCDSCSGRGYIEQYSFADMLDHCSSRGPDLEDCSSCGTKGMRGCEQCGG